MHSKDYWMHGSWHARNGCRWRCWREARGTFTVLWRKRHQKVSKSVPSWKRSGSERGLAPHSEWSLKNKTPLSSFLNASRISVCDVPPFDFCNFTLSENYSTQLVATASQSQQNHPTKLCTLSSLAEEWSLGIQGTEPVAGDLQPGTSHTWPGAQDVSSKNAGMLTDDAPVSPGKQDMSRALGSHFKFEYQGSDN